LKVYGLVEKSLEYSNYNLYKMHKHTQITEHYCIQGWTAIGEWAGVPMRFIGELCKPLSNEKYVVFYSYHYFDDTQSYELLDLEVIKDSQPILGYEINGEKSDIGDGVHLRLIVKTQFG
jgi:DMSO/TMAO reductase YedYZ molybdopterin-dependent catalytic subunit